MYFSVILASFQALSSHIWQRAMIVDSTELGHLCHHKMSIEQCLNGTLAVIVKVKRKGTQSTRPFLTEG